MLLREPTSWISTEVGAHEQPEERSQLIDDHDVIENRSLTNMINEYQSHV